MARYAPRMKWMAKIWAAIDECPGGPEPGGASFMHIRVPHALAGWHFQITGGHQKIRHVFHGRVGKVLRVLSIGTFSVAVLAQVHAHDHIRLGLVRPVSLQHEVCQVLPDPVGHVDTLS